MFFYNNIGNFLYISEFFIFIYFYIFFEGGSFLALFRGDTDSVFLTRPDKTLNKDTDYLFSSRHELSCDRTIVDSHVGKSQFLIF